MCAAIVAVLAGAARAEPDPQIAYLARTGPYWQVWVVQSDGSGARQVTHSKIEKSRCSWFPGGHRLLVNAQDGQVYQVELESGTETRLDLGATGMLDAVVSPDGTAVAYSAQRTAEGPASGDANDIWVASLTGGPERRVAAMRGLQAEPSWSPDSAWVYFFSAENRQRNSLWRVSPDASQREQIPVGKGFHFDSSVAPNGDLVFSNDVTGDYELWLLRSKGKSPTQLTHDPAADIRPSFSPDGRRIVFESSRGGMPNLWVLSLEDGSQTQLTHQQAGARSPAWSRGAK